VHAFKLLIILSLLLPTLSLKVKGQGDFIVDDAEGCTPMKVKYTFTYSGVDTFSTFYWDFGNGETSTLEEPDTVTYDAPGTYTPTLVFNGRGDQMITKVNLITVHRTASANFNFDAPTSSLYYYELEHAATLDAGVTYTFNWNIEEFGARTGANQSITFPRVDTFTVSLTVTDEFGCANTITKDIAIAGDVYVPNVFSPGGDDDIDDYFIIKSNGGFPLRVRIYSRTGVLVYEGEGLIITWNGETASGDKMKTGVYFYTLEAITGDPQKRYSKSGFLHLYRND
jgi:gliding motility-associated-like protein